MNNDLISRSALLDKAVPKEKTSDLICQFVTVKDIKAAPAVDAVEVVRCKDCIHYQKYPDYANECWHNSGMLNVYDDCFCSRGERRSDAYTEKKVL